MARVLEITQKRAAERLVRIEAIKVFVVDYALSLGVDELSPTDLDEVAAYTYRREALVGLMAKATPFSERYNEISKEIVDCEAGIGCVAPWLI